MKKNIDGILIFYVRTEMVHGFRFLYSTNLDNETTLPPPLEEASQLGSQRVG